MPPRYDSEGYDRNGRKKIKFQETPERPGLDEFYALQNRSIPAFSRPGGPMSAQDVAGSYYNQGISLGPNGAMPRNYGAPQRTAPGVRPQGYQPIYTSDNVDSSSFGKQIAEARRRAEVGDTGIYSPPEDRQAPMPRAIANDLGPDSLIHQNGRYSTVIPAIGQDTFRNSTTGFPRVDSSPLSPQTTQATPDERRAELELLRDAKRGNVVTNKTADGSQITSKYGTATVKNMTPSEFANRPQATIEGMPASEFFKRSAARQNAPNEFSSVSQGQDFLGDERRRNESNAAKNVAEGNKISDELRKRRVPSARNA